MTDAEGAVVRLAGYAAVFDVPDRGRDVVRAGAFSGVRLPVPLLWQHGADRPVGRVVEAVEDMRGLRVLAEFARDSESAREAAALVRAGALSGLSFGYRTRKARADRARSVRELLSVELVEVSLVTFPMQPMARVLRVFSEERVSA
ncbi:MAG: HK97 family phage prohead protease [Pacificimonas sp.]